MNPGDWTNAVKAGVIALVNSFMALILATAVIVGWQVDTDDFAMLSLALEGFVNAALGLWIVLTYRNSPARATQRQLKSRGLRP